MDCFQLNYQYMKRCVQNGPVTPMAEQWWLDILRMIPPHLVTAQHLQGHITQLQEEVHGEYEASMKKAMGNVLHVFVKFRVSSR